MLALGHSNLARFSPPPLGSLADANSGIFATHTLQSASAPLKHLDGHPPTSSLHQTALSLPQTPHHAMLPRDRISLHILTRQSAALALLIHTHDASHPPARVSRPSISLKGAYPTIAHLPRRHCAFLVEVELSLAKEKLSSVARLTVLLEASTPPRLRASEDEASRIAEAVRAWVARGAFRAAAGAPDGRPNRRRERAYW